MLILSRLVFLARSNMTYNVVAFPGRVPKSIRDDPKV